MNNPIKQLPNGDFEVQAEITGVLKNWRIESSFNTGNRIATGNIYGDTKKRFPDGAPIYTSRILKHEGDIITTKNSVYRLEGPGADDTA